MDLYTGAASPKDFMEVMYLETAMGRYLKNHSLRQKYLLESILSYAIPT